MQYINGVPHFSIYTVLLIAVVFVVLTVWAVTAAKSTERMVVETTVLLTIYRLMDLQTNRQGSTVDEILRASGGVLNVAFSRWTLKAALWELVDEGVLFRTPDEEPRYVLSPKGRRALEKGYKRPPPEEETF